MPFKNSEEKRSLIDTVLRKLIGSPRDIWDASIFRKISLVPVLAWVGLGASFGGVYPFAEI